MARKQAVNGHDAANKDGASFPTSTLAAQMIVDRQPSTSATFSQLLDEIRANPSAVEKDTESNKQLVRVVAEAGLDDSSAKGHLEHESEICRRILASLEVIGIAVDRTPAVLATGVNDEDADSCLLYLLLRVIVSLLKHSPLWSGLQQLLSKLLSHFYAAPDLWSHASFVEGCFRICAGDVLSGLATSEGVDIQDLNIDVFFPSLSARAATANRTHQLTIAPSGRRVKIRTVDHAIVVVSSMVLASVTNAGASNLPKPSIPESNLGQNQTWRLKAMQILWDRLQKFLDPPSTLSTGWIPFFMVVEQLVRSTSYTFEDTASHRRACAFAGGCLVYFVEQQSRSLLVQDIETLNPIVHSIVRSLLACRQVSQVLPRLLEITRKTLESPVANADLKKSLQQIYEVLLKSNRAPSQRAVSSAAIVNGAKSNGALGADPTVSGEVDRPLKRRKVARSASPPASNRGRQSDLREICLLLGDWSIDRLETLPAAVPELFSDLTDEDKEKVLTLLANIECEPDGSPALVTDRDLSSEYCCRCHNGRRSSDLEATTQWPKGRWQILHTISASLLGSESLQRSKRHRVSAMTLVQRIACHSASGYWLDLNESPMGKWCLQGLRSSYRELRIAAGCALPMFLNGDGLGKDQSLDEKLTRKNRVVALNLLRSLSQTDDSRVTETIIMALGNVARACGDDERNLILLQLVDYLGNSNAFLSGLADLELKQIAQALQVSPEELLRPFWRSIAITIVKDLHTRPQKAQQMSDILGVSVNQFLVSTQADTVPYLVHWRELDILKRIARARNHESTVWEICMDSANLTATLSRLLTLNATNGEAVITECLRQINPAFGADDAAALLRTEPIAIACEILKTAADAEDQAKASAIQGFKDLAAIVERRGHATRTATTQARMTTLFLENHALGIMAAFSDAIDSPTLSNVEKRRCLGGIEEMISVGRTDVSIALPQIRACLYSALEITALCNDAFSAWLALLTAVEGEDLETLIDHTFTVIVEKWSSFTSKMQQRAHDAVGDLLRNFSTLVQGIVEGLPSLSSIPLMSKFESQLSRIRGQTEISQRLRSFSRRCQDENAMVVIRALRELRPYLDENQEWIHDSAASEQPFPVIPELMRALLDTCSKFNDSDADILSVAAECLGIIGSLDPNRVETVKEQQEILLLSNLTQASEAIDFVAFLLEHVLVKAFHSVSNPRAQGFLAYVMQELLRFCGLGKEATHPYRPQGSQTDDTLQRWKAMPEAVRNTLSPFLSSRYVLATKSAKQASPKTYPIYAKGQMHAVWLRDTVFDLLQKAKGDNAKMIFSVLSRIIRGFDVSIAGFLLPFVAANVIIGGTTDEAQMVREELLTILKETPSTYTPSEMEQLKRCSENVFQVLDYLSRWLQEKRKGLSAARNIAERAGRRLDGLAEASDKGQIETVEKLLSSIPADVISRRAIECGSFARALLHWEEYMRQQQRLRSLPLDQGVQDDDLYQRLQDIYTQIDDPDGIEGVSSCLYVLSPDQQVLEHRRAGRWAAAQSWYEIQFQDSNRDKESLRVDLLTCLRDAGQYSGVIDQVSGFDKTARNLPAMLSIANQAAWSSENWDALETFAPGHGPLPSDFNLAVGSALKKLRAQDHGMYLEVISEIRLRVAKGLSSARVASLHSCREQLLQLHALYELEIINGSGHTERSTDSDSVVKMLNHRLSILGSSLTTKQYLLSIRRAAMSLSALGFRKEDLASSWMVAAKIARKGPTPSLAYDAVFRAAKLGDESATIEQARLLWIGGEHRKAIQSLQGAIAANAFGGRGGAQASGAVNNSTALASTTASRTAEDRSPQNILVARAHLLLAKWLDRAGQTQSDTILSQYRQATNSFHRWEKSLYYLGKFYNKLLDSEKSMAPGRQSIRYLNGEMAKLVVENYLRSVTFGCKYLFQTLPKLLTLWLDFGVEVNRAISREVPDDIRNKAAESRPKMMEAMNKQVRKYADKIVSYVFYTALPQMITRISHSNTKVWDVLSSIIVKIVSNHPQQALWSLLAVVKSTSHDRLSRGMALLNRLKERSTKIRSEGMSVDLRELVTKGQRMSDELLHACEVQLPNRTSLISLTRDLHFKTKVAPCPLVIPLEKTLSASLPAANGSVQMKSHRAFPMSREAITISSFEDSVLVLSSLQKPRKLTIKGSDGRTYALLCKPNDDLRKDQRLMEFNAMINRGLKKDAASASRRLYIKTYAVTPLNEACGLIEWVEGLKPLRDILIALYKTKSIKVDYRLLQELLNDACSNPPSTTQIFTNTILPMYRPILHEWFTDLFPGPDAWFAARTRYARSAAVASMTGHVLGLGDRHGENVLLEEKTGGVFHVDFNCLFDKGLTFEKPELVPFRLTHNMVDALGATGTEGTFRRGAECAMSVMREQEDALLTILETFVYDPTADFVGPRRRAVRYVPETPKEVLESVRGKVRGLLAGESLPLSVQGHVDALVKMATDPGRLCAMYIGWCAFL